jgi:hypothetical protein
VEAVDGSHGPNLSAHDSASNLKWVNGWFFLADAMQQWAKSGAAILLPK